MSEQQDLFGPRGPRVYSVSEITESVRRMLDETFTDVVIEGEISNARQHSSGHWYFTLKDDAAQISAVLFRNDARTVRFELENGLSVQATGRLSLYPPQGRFQIVVRSLLPVGQGALELAFRQLQQKLQAEGLFDESRKRPLPRIPGRIALITSPTGAAVRDMLRTLCDRWPLVMVDVVPVAVQGDAAPGEIIRALQFVNRLALADVLIVGRGGGSLEDLWAFNDEGVARAIAASNIPVISAVGHEVDFTIADFVADVRAATPTAAATLVVPDRAEIRKSIQNLQRRMARALKRHCELQQKRLDALARSYGLRRPQLLIQEAQQKLDGCLERMVRALDTQMERRRASAAALRAQLLALSPLGVLSRGYSYCVDPSTGHVVGSAAETHVDQSLRIHFGDGIVPARVMGARVQQEGGDEGPAPRPETATKGES